MAQQPELKPKSISCGNCGHQNLANAKNCIVCDAPLTYTSRFQRKQKMPTGLLPPKEEEQEPDELQEDEPQEQDTAPRKSSGRRTGIKCGDCGYVNRVGDLFCVECGADISNVPRQDSPADITQQMKALSLREVQAEIEKQQMREREQAIQQPPQARKVTKPDLKSVDEGDIEDGCFQFTGDMLLRFTDVVSERYIEVTPNKDRPLLLGRSHESLPVQPDVDLTPFLIEQHGVSRRHALMRVRDLRLEIQDLNSTNGTGINGYRFRPKETHQIRSGDIVTLGRISVCVVFMRRSAMSSGHVTDKLT